MIRLISLFMVMVLCQNSFCQLNDSSVNYYLTDSLEGKWSGKFFDQKSNQTVSIEIVFRRHKEQLKIFSYSYIFDDIAICEMNLKQLSGDSICLTEFIVLQPKRKYDLCLQTMKILVKSENNELIMTGFWESPGFEKCGKGGLYLKKNIKGRKNYRHSDN